MYSTYQNIERKMFWKSLFNRIKFRSIPVRSGAERCRANITNPLPIIPIIVDDNSFKNGRSALGRSFNRTDSPGKFCPSLRWPSSPALPISILLGLVRLRKICSTCQVDPIKRYRHLEKIGTGGFSEVFVAYHIGTNARVAIKKLKLNSGAITQTCINEIIVLKRSNHKNIIRYINSYLFNRELWIVMDFMNGASLTDIVMTVKMTEGQIAAILKEVRKHQHATAYNRYCKEFITYIRRASSIAI